MPIGPPWSEVRITSAAFLIVKGPRPSFVEKVVALGVSCIHTGAAPLARPSEKSVRAVSIEPATWAGPKTRFRGSVDPPRRKTGREGAEAGPELKIWQGGMEREGGSATGRPISPPP